MRKKHTLERAKLPALQRRTIKLAREARLISAKAKNPHQIPPNLDPEQGIAERELMDEAALYFEAAFRAGWPVYWVTVCHPDWTVFGRQNRIEVVKASRNWLSRRARRLPIGMMAGAVDISRNHKRAVGMANGWCNHAHFLFTAGPGDTEELRSLVRKAFQCPIDRTDWKLQGAYVVAVTDLQSLWNYSDYASGAFVVHDGRGQRCERRLRISSDKQASKQHLKPRHRKQFTRMMDGLGPEKFWTLSGFIRRGDKLIFKPTRALLDTGFAVDLEARRADLPRELDARIRGRKVPTPRPKRGKVGAATAVVNGDKTDRIGYRRPHDATGRSKPEGARRQSALKLRKK